MIKINLLPQQTAEKKSKVEKGFALFVFGLILAALSIYGVDYYYNGILGQLKKEQDQKTQTKQLLAVQVEKVNAVLVELEDMEKRIEVIKSVRKRQGLPVRYIDEIVMRIPKDKLWFETFTINANGAISLSGIALDNQAFAGYVESLRTSNFIANVNTQRTSRRSVDGLGLIAFQCSVTAQEYFETFNVDGSTNG